jgi:RNA polymerase sigma factor (TIGR02999 family)
MATEPAGHTLQPTALVHEVWLRLGADSQPTWKNRAHFFGAAAEAMRRILVDNARRKASLKRGGKWARVELEECEIEAPMPPAEMVALDEALEELAQVDPRGTELVKLRFFAGFTQQEAAQTLGISVATAERTWAFCRTWLYRKVKESDPIIS